jgi:hypothetical protein
MDELVLNWTKELAWEDNPFKKQFLEPIEKTIGGYEKERQKLNLLLLNELPFGTITGQEGMGKTLLLKWFTSQLDKHPEKFIYAYLDKKQLADASFIQNICSPFKNKHSLAKLFKKEEKITKKNVSEYILKNSEHKHFLIIIDDANLLSKEDIETLEQLKQVPKVQIILAGKSFDKMNLKSFEKDNLGIDIKKMDFPSGRDMLKRRIESVGGSDIWPFSDKIIKDIFGLGDYNPKKILTLCQERAKELAIEVKQGKIKPPEHRLIKIEHEEHEISYEDHPIEHPPVEKKRKDDGFVVKFTFKDDEEKKSMDAMAVPDETEEIEKTKEEEKKSAEKKTAKEQKEEKPSKKEKTPEEKIPEKEEKKKEESIIDINLGYEEKPKKEAKPRKMEAFDIDIRPKKKK